MCFQNTISLETGLSDFKKMTISVLNYHFIKHKPKVINYQDYKYYSNEVFFNVFISEITQNNIGHSDFDLYKEVFLSILNKHAPIKQKYVRANQAPCMNKILQKAVMNRSRLRNRFLKNRTDENKIAYTKQKNFCVSLF